MNSIRCFIVAVLTSLAAVGCGNDAEPSTNTDPASPSTATENVVEVDLTEYTFGVPDEVSGGTVTFEANNSGALPHEMAFGSLEEGRTLDDVMKALQSRREPKWLEDLAGIPVLSPGVTASMTRDLDQGQYVFLCFLPTPEGQPHAAEGMATVFNVTGTSEAEAPEPDLTISATDKGFEVPEIGAGTHTIELKNEGTKPHEFAFVSYESGKTAKDLEAWFGSGFKTDAPAIFPGGLQSIEPDTSVVVEMTFEAGRTYALEDFENGLSTEIVVD